MSAAAGFGEVVDDRLQRIERVVRRPRDKRDESCPLPGVSIGTGVSSACRTERSSNSAFSASTSGCSCTPHTPTHWPVSSAGSRTRPARRLLPAGTAAGDRRICHQHLRQQPAVGMPLSITCGGTGAWMSVSHFGAGPLAADVPLDPDHAGR